MTILRDVFAELFSMFVGDARLSLSILGVVALTALLIKVAPAQPLISGGVLLAGSLLVVIVAVRRASRRDAVVKAAEPPADRL